MTQTLLTRGRYRTGHGTFADPAFTASRTRILELRRACFGTPAEDRFDQCCDHVIVEAQEDGTLACAFRLLTFDRAEAVQDSYSAGFYGLDGLAGLGIPMVELGRFCVRPGLRNTDVLRMAWGAIAAHVDRTGAGMLFGCSSFHGTDAGPYADALGLLAADHLAPADWRPTVRAAETVALPPGGQEGQLDRRAALRQMPPLLRSYLSMGGRVSDHAVVDRDMGTLHVFTGLPIDAIPRRRAEALRGLARGLPVGDTGDS